MPLLEAPQEYNDSSPEQSVSQDFNGGQPHLHDIQIRIHTPEARNIVNTGGGPVIHIRHNPNSRLPRLGSYDRDIPTLEEDNHYPPAVHLLPVVLPSQVPEPTLDELLRRVTQRNDLQEVESVRLRVITYSLSLSRLSLFLPRLQQLDLSGSVLCSLRDLGYGLIHLTHLNISNCGLNSFDGCSGLPGLRVLIGDGNMIQRINPLTELPLLERLIARNNRISELGLLTFLAMCPNINEIDLRGNPVCHMTLYRITLHRSIPTLQILDGQSFEGEEIQNANNDQPEIGDHSSHTDSDTLSSLSSEVNSESMQSNTNYRPSTAPTNGSGNMIDIQLNRPSSVPQRRDSLSLGEPIVGAIINVNRRSRSQRFRSTSQAWQSSNSSLSSNSSSRPPSSKSSNSCSSDIQLPQ